MADAALEDGRLLSNLRVADLKVELSKRGLTQSGKKSDLIARLTTALSGPGQYGNAEEVDMSEVITVPSDQEKMDEEEDVVQVHNQTCLDEEEEEKLDYEAADSVIVSTSVEEVDELLVEPTTSQSAEVTQEAGEVDSTPETTSSQARLRRGGETDAAAALAHKRRWGGGSNASDSSQVAAEMAEPHSESVVHQEVPPSRSSSSSSHRVVSVDRSETDHRATRHASNGSHRHRMEEEIAMQEEVEQQRLKELRLQDALKRERLLGKGTAEPSAQAATVQRSSSSSVDGRHSTAAPGVARATVAPVTLAGQEPVPRAGEGTPPRQAVCCTLSVHGLVRPFTLPQLKSLLGRHGSLVAEGGFWIDRIKSHCYVSFEEESSAVECRNALHGARWPPTSPRVLAVDFASPTLIRAETNGTMAVRHSDGSSAEAIVTSVNEKTSVDENRPQVDKRVELEARRAERERERERRGPDRERQQAASPRRSREADSVVPGSKSHPHVIAHDEVAAPANVLDQLFRKTKTLPALYWLPLTDEQANAKELAAKAAGPSSSRRSPARRRSRSRSPRGRYMY